MSHNRKDNTPPDPKLPPSDPLSIDQAVEKGLPPTHPTGADDATKPHGAATLGPLEGVPRLEVSKYASQKGLEVEEDPVKTQAKIENELRHRLGWTIIILTFSLNFFTIAFITWLANKDQELIHQLIQADPQHASEAMRGIVRLVTPGVVVSLVGATVVQVGAAMFVITQYLFPGETGRSTRRRSPRGSRSGKTPSNR
jgi:hypothetical protein